MKKQTNIVLNDDGNDLEFIIEAMPATKSYDFLVQALLLLGGCGLDLADGDETPSLEGAARSLSNGGLAKLCRLDYDKAKPLLNDLISCCTRITKDGMGGGVVKQPCTPGTIDGYITDPRTIFKLQVEALKVNFGFFGQGAESPFDSPEVLNMGQPGKAKA